MGDTEPFSFKPYKVIKQTVILDFDYENELILGFTEIYVDIINDTLDQLSLHCHPCTIHQVSLNDKFTSNYIIPVDGDFSTFLRDSDETFQGLAKVQMDEVREKTSWIPAIVSAVEQQKFSKAMLLLKENVIQYFIEKGNLKINLPLIEPSKNKIKLGIHFSLDCSDSILSPVHFAKKIINNSNSLELNYVNGATLEAQVVFPCFNHYSDRCSDWEFNFIVSSSLISSNRYNEGSFKFLPVCTGNLVQTQIYEEENSVRYIVKSQNAMSASHFGFILGTFDIMDIQEPQFSSLDTLGETSDEDFKPPGNVLVYCLPGKREAALYTIDPILCILKYYEWLLHTELPSKTLSIVFAEGFENPILNNFGLIFLSQHLLLSPKIIDATYSTRRLLAYAIAYQYTFYKTLPKDLADSWLLQGLTSYISDEFLGKYHGQAEMLFKKKRDMDTVISLDVDQPPLYYNEWESIGQSCTEFAKLKSGLVYHMISSKIGRGSFFKILNILYSYCSNTGTNNGVGGDTVCSVETNVVIIVSTLDFLKLIRKVTGKDLKEFAMQWIYRSKHLIPSCRLAKATTEPQFCHYHPCSKSSCYV